MNDTPPNTITHRVNARNSAAVVCGSVRFAPGKAAWLFVMLIAAVVGGAQTLSVSAVAVFLVSTSTVLLFGHSLGSHRKLIHDSFQCPAWLEYLLVWLGVQVGLAGPIGLLKQHELRDYAQRLPDCHPYLRHGTTWWRDAWWQLCCELHLDEPPTITIEPRIAENSFFRFIERTWMLQQVVPALLLFGLGGWAFVFWGVCARVVAGVVGHWLIGHLAHNRGGMHYRVSTAAVQGRNIRFSSLLTMGESWHNNHHAFPGSAKLGLFPGEWDPGWWMLMILQRLGLVWNFRLPVHLPHRAELESIDVHAARGQYQMNPATPLNAWLALRLCLFPAQIASQCALSMEGPAAFLPQSAFTRMAPHALPFSFDPGIHRLALQVGSTRLQGLPAICALLCMRRGVAQAIGLLLAPLAIAVEAIRLHCTSARPIDLQSHQSNRRH